MSKHKDALYMGYACFVLPFAGFVLRLLIAR